VMQDMLKAYRQVIVLFSDEKSQKLEERTATNRIGYQIYNENRARRDQLDQGLALLAASPYALRFEVLDELLTWVESGRDLFDADRLAFRENLRTLLTAVSTDQSLPAVKLHKRISEDLAALDEIENLYDKELKEIFGRFETRGIELQRQRWDDYVAKLRGLFKRDQILKDYGTIVPYPSSAKASSGEISGRELPPKTLVLSFDDGPHGTYSEEIAAILKPYGIHGIFFELGTQLGTVKPDGQVQPGRLTAVARKLLAEGHTLGDHSFSHANFAKESDARLRTEIVEVETLLHGLGGAPSGLFRFPFGARTDQALETLKSFKLQSVYWTIDSLDWADPVPNSIANRVLQTIETEQRGIVLFHDINERTVKALPTILDRLVAEGYRFASWDGTGFKIGDTPVTTARAKPTTGYRESWAVVVGVDDYSKWPHLQYASRDAEAVRQMLVEKLGFTEKHVFLLKNQEATRANILALLHRTLGSENVQKDDRVFVFFAGHGTTKKLSSGRDLGYIVPVDSDPANAASDAIPMTELQNIAEELPAKHVLFVMDACYSGLGLVRGGSAQNYLKENARRMGRQMLTAGGSDQLVADGGPGGHSIFTWTLLQGLSGKADLNGDGFITGTELAAYLGPAVSSVSHQTPAFGSLPGSEGGEFVFELAAETEFLNADAPQLDSRAIAMNQKLDAKSEQLKQGANTAAMQVTVKGLEGADTKITAVQKVAVQPRQAAQRAHDLGLLYYREKRYVEAEAQFTESLKLRPDFALAANNLGFVYFKQDKFFEAARWFENALRMDPSRAIAYFNLGEAYLKAGDKPKARKALETYLALAPKASNADRAKALLKQI
jgi:uncharacterized caspase-like protein/peptidoglycan/xylan/chitin deacetylase (PgdA/CDA1 family)